MSNFDIKLRWKIHQQIDEVNHKYARSLRIKEILSRKNFYHEFNPITHICNLCGITDIEYHSSHIDNRQICPKYKGTFIVQKQKEQ